MGKKYRVIKATTAPISGVKLDNEHGVTFKRNGSDVVVDEGVARELDAAYGRKGSEHPGQVVVVPMDKPGQYNTKLYRVPELPWKKGKPDGSQTTQEMQAKKVGANDDNPC